MKIADLLQPAGTSFNDDETWVGVEGTVNTTLVPDTAVVWIEGTNHWKDWITNMWFFPVWALGEYKVHSGWWDELRSVREKILELAEGSKRMIIVGHSKGGGTAQLLALSLCRSAVPLDWLVLTGAPKAGNFAVKQELEAVIGKHSILNYQVRGDIVPRVPNMLLTVLAMPLRIIVNTLTRKPLNLCVFRTVGKVKKIGKWKLINIKDHYVNRYKELLKDELFL